MIADQRMRASIFGFRISISANSARHRTLELTRPRDLNSWFRASFIIEFTLPQRPTICSATANQLTRFLASRNSPPLYTIAHSR